MRRAAVALSGCDPARHQPNRDVEVLRFRRGELDLINSIDAEYFDRLAASSPAVVHDAGASLDSEFMWFNQVANSPIPAYKRNWFRSTTFRRAMSGAINREDLSRVVFSGHAQPGVAPSRRLTSSGSTTGSKRNCTAPMLPYIVCNRCVSAETASARKV